MLYGVDLIDRDHVPQIEEAMKVIRHPFDDWAVVADPRGQAEYFAAKEAAVKIMSPALRSLVDIEELRVARGAGGLVVWSGLWPHEIAVNTVHLDGAVLALGCSLDLDADPRSPRPLP